jgi:hypothetical protein
LPVEKNLKPYQSEVFAPYFSKNSYNAKRSLSKEKKKEMVDVIYRYR